MSDFRSSYDDQPAAVAGGGRRRGRPARRLGAQDARRAAGGVAAVAIVAATFFWLGRQDPAGIGAPELIRAEPGPYKVKPADPGGLDVAGESETAFQTSAGEDQRRPARPERAARGGGRAPAQAGTASAAQAHPAQRDQGAGGRARRPRRRRSRPAARAASIQLGAYESPPKAETRLDRAVDPLPERQGDDQAGGAVRRAAIRLRAGAASSADAKQACQALKAAGENCFVANHDAGGDLRAGGAGAHAPTSALSSATPMPPATSCSGAIAATRRSCAR